ncbi:cytochrome P450 [Nocardia takedensis]|uniref:cytochrome P450 n=1 Tax=Nocardia takedensis TaxID=259390 RepID=UPI000592ADC2|nr:cytochrome P450 [Nocardia takedensis]
MKPRYWVRWSAEHGVRRAFLRWQLRRGDPFAQLLNGERGLRDPHPLIRQLRGEGGLRRTPLAMVAFEHGHVRTILRDPRFAVQPSIPQDLPAPFRRVAERVRMPVNPMNPPAMLLLNPPEHTRMRKPVASAFTPRAIARLRDRVEVVTAEILEAMPPDGSVDLIDDFASRMPMTIIADMLGFAPSVRAQFQHWGDRITPLFDVGTSWRSYGRAMAAMESMNEFFENHIAELRREPGEDILSALVASGELNTRELLVSAGVLLGAGLETTVNLIGNAVASLSANPDQLALALAEPERWGAVVEETLRFDPPVVAAARLATEDIDVDGQTVPAGTTVMLSLAGANRDPLVFENPDRFDITRPNAADHVAFSSGIHVCLGATLARMEAEHALRSLYTRYPNLRLRGEPRRRRLFTLRGYQHMPADLGPVARAHTPN